MTYYQTLGLNPSEATINEITCSFRSLAVANHPLRKNDNKIAERQKAFSKICEAYDVLSTPELRAIYD